MSVREPLWKSWDVAANKSGPHSTIYTVQENPEYATARRLGGAAGKVARYKTGSRYTGDWKSNKRDGFGTYTWSNGNKYEGDWLQGVRHGKGTYWVKDGRRVRKQYTGNWAKNRHDGLGIFYYKNGEKYEGEWLSGLRHGRGKMVYSDGNVYEGDWSEGKRAGLGVLTLANGDRFEGHWLNDAKEGPGRFFYASTGKVYEGEWVDSVAKCGVYMDVSEAEAAMQPFSLPSLELHDAEGVLDGAVASTRRLRASQLGERASLAAADDEEAAFTEEEFEDLREAFRAVDANDTGSVAASEIIDVLNELGIFPREEDLRTLLEEMGTGDDPSTEVSFNEFVGVLASLKME